MFCLLFLGLIDFNRKNRQILTLDPSSVKSHFVTYSAIPSLV
jgi:hypothetical protein